jgi:hypothetical protein
MLPLQGSSHSLPAMQLLQEGWSRLFMKGAETLVLPAGLLVAAVLQYYSAATAGGGYGACDSHHCATLDAVVVVVRKFRDLHQPRCLP